MFDYPEPLMASLPSFPPMVGVFEDDPEIVEAVDGYLNLAIDNTQVEEEEDTVAGWSLVYEFPDQSFSFSRGFALGQLWERLRRRDKSDFVIMTIWVHDAVDLAKAQGWIAETVPLEEDMAWSTVSFREFKLHLVTKDSNDGEGTQI